MLRALFEWIIDNDLTPYLLVNELTDNLMVPDGIANDNKIIFNLSPGSIRDLELLNEGVMFSARFHGKAENIYIPMNAILAIYANENGEGMMFPEHVDGLSNETSQNTVDVKKKAPAKPSLKLV